MNQEILKSAPVKTGVDLNSLKEEYNKFKTPTEVEEVVVEKTTRIVTLKVNVNCGCGFDVVEITREVDVNSDLQDGTVIDQEDVLMTDEIKSIY